MANITINTSEDWSSISLDSLTLGQEVAAFVTHLDQLFTEFHASAFSGESGGGTVTMNSGGQLVFAGSGLGTPASAQLTAFNFSNAGEVVLFNGSADGAGDDSYTTLSLTRSGHTITLTGSIGFNNDTDTFSGTVSTLEFTTIAGDEILMHGTATIGGPGSAPVFGGTIADLTVNTAGALNVLTGVNLVTTLVNVANSSLLTLSTLTSLALVGNDTITGDANDNLLAGSDGNDSLIGLAGADTLDGGLGNDSMAGGAGSDTYLVDSLLDKVVEAASGGTDTVEASINYSLAALANVENLTLTGTAISGTGNAGNNVLTGNDATNTLTGAGGNDYYILDSAADQAVELAAGGTSDTVEIAFGTNILLSGYANLENLVMANAEGVGTGTAAANVLSSKNGAHTLNGGLGNDTYYVQSGDVAAEDTSGGGIKDTVFASLSGGQSWALGDGIENLNLLSLGGGDIAGIGNGLANLITGSIAADSLAGGAGNDTISGGADNDTINGGSGKNSLAGGLGDDRYYATLINPTPTTVALDGTIVDTGGIDMLIVYAGESVFIPAAFNLTLNAAIENLDFSSVDGQNLVATGNTLGNKITGNWGNNKIDGGAGNDSLDGGDGSDTLLGGAGNDTLEGGGNGAGPEWLDGGLGDDLYLEHGTNATYVIAQAGDSVIDGGEAGGIDTVRVALAASTYLDISGISFLDNVVFTGAGPVTLRGNAGANSLLGGAGADSFYGGLGDDTYGANSALDKIDDEGGTDTVVASVTYSIAALNGIENLTLGGTAAKATGNGGDNVLTGNAAANTLDGGAGADTMIGGAGADVYLVDDTADIVQETMVGAAGGIDQVNTSSDFSLADTQIENATVTGITGRSLTGNALANKLTGFTGSDTLAGGDLNDTLTGNAGEDRLDGGSGVDSMVGGLGNDTYVVDSLLDKITEAAGVNTAGVDTVESSITWSIAATPNLENITLTGGDAINATGNAWHNVLVGNSGNNSIFGGVGQDTLDGGAGADTLDGGLGHDTYEYDPDDVIVEAVNGNIDTVTSSTLSVTALATNVEDILLTGSANLDATGNSGVNNITGNDGDNVLKGLGDNDHIEGGAGNDTAVYVGNQAQYTLVDIGGGNIRVTHLNSGADGVDIIHNVENIRFADTGDLVLAEMDLSPPAPTPSLKVELDAGLRLSGTGTIQISFSFMSAEPSYTDYPGHDNVAAPNDALKDAIRGALHLWEEVTKIHFNETTDAESVQFRFATEKVFEDDGVTPVDTLAAYAFLPTGSPANGASQDAGDVWINRNFFLYDDSLAANFVPGTSVFSTLIHEIGHALGLDHPFDDGGDEHFLADGAFDNNNLYSIMAYDPAPNSDLVQWANLDDFWYGFGGTVEARTPMLYDISTIQAMYGVNTATRAGDTTYGTHVADGGYAFGIGQPFLLTIWDGGGTDTIDVSHLSLPNIIDLRPGHFSSIGMSEFLGINDLGDHVNHGIFTPEGDTVAEEGYDYLEPVPEAPFGILTDFSSDHPMDWDPETDGIYVGANNLTIAETAVIENAIGGSGNDSITGNDWSNTLSGRLGNDTLKGGLGADYFVFDTTLNATTNVDLLSGFDHGVDVIVLDKTIFAALPLGALVDDDIGIFLTGDHIRYDVLTGNLYYDADGLTSTADIKFATRGVADASLSASDFLVIA